MPSTGWLATAAAGLALVLASLELTAWLYSSYAEENLVRLSDPRVSASAELAARLAPWATAPAALHAWTMANGDRPAEAQAAYLRTLRWAPGDALVWAEYALALGRMGVFD